MPAAARPARPEQLDWDGFRDLYHPGTRRHDLEALVAYGVYRKSQAGGVPPVAARGTGERTPAEAGTVEGWEDEGGAAR